MPLEFHETFCLALEAMERGDSHVFITGKAGTGKSTLLKHFRENTAKNCVVLAPTGVAALNVQGETIHSFFGFKPGIAVQEIQENPPRRRLALYKNLEILVVDEVSMVRADLLDCVDAFLKAARKSKRPFGGVQCVFIGDLHQLPPVVRQDEREALAERYGAATPHFFHADVLRGLFEAGEIAFIELDKIFRQKDELFVEILNAVRDRCLTQQQLDTLNARCQKPGTPAYVGKDLVLCATNAQADAINQKNLQALGTSGRSYDGVLDGDFARKDLPTDNPLHLKPGARVMLLNNDSQGLWVNGSLGVIRALYNGHAEVALDSGINITVHAFAWDMYRSTYDKKQRVLRQERIGGFLQLPLRLAWATTIHKSQGKTFDHLTIDLSRGMFAPGQLYVALSRCRTLAGITLTHPLKPSHLMTDYACSRFLQALRLQQRAAQKPSQATELEGLIS